MSAHAFCLYKDWKKQNIHAVARDRRIMHTFPSYLTGFVSYPDVKHFCTFVTNQLDVDVHAAYAGQLRIDE